MSKKTLYLMGILATILIGTFLYNSMCCQTCAAEKTQIPEIAATGDYKNFNLSGRDMAYSCNDNFRFLSNGFNNIQPVNDSIHTGIGLLKSYFDKNQNDKLVITGYAMKTEKNTSAFPNLALARANDLKSYFVSKGIATNRFELKGELIDAWKMSADTLLGPADFRIMQGEELAAAPKEDWNALKSSINANPLTLYFQTNQTDVDLSTEDRQKVADLAKYLDNVADAKLTAVGHTDNAGDRDVNTKLGLGRANFAKEYLAKNGIDGQKVETSSKGPDQPIADNATPDGKAKNRRTVVTIK
jgi:OmpA-OmpF porin, OOP family